MAISLGDKSNKKKPLLFDSFLSCLETFDFLIRCGEKLSNTSLSFSHVKYNCYWRCFPIKKPIQHNVHNYNIVKKGCVGLISAD